MSYRCLRFQLGEDIKEGFPVAILLMIQLIKMTRIISIMFMFGVIVIVIIIGDQWIVGINNLCLIANSRIEQMRGFIMVEV